MQHISTEKSPQAIGPYSQAIVANGFVFVAGQLPIDPRTGQIMSGGIVSQTSQAMENIGCILEAAGTGLDRVVKATIFLKDLGNFDAVNEVYGRYFSATRPARSTVEVSRLPRDAGIEIEVIALAAESSEGAS